MGVVALRRHVLRCAPSQHVCRRACPGRGEPAGGLFERAPEQASGLRPPPEAPASLGQPAARSALARRPYTGLAFRHTIARVRPTRFQVPTALRVAHEGLHECRELRHVEVGRGELRLDLGRACEVEGGRTGDFGGGSLEHLRRWRGARWPDLSPWCLGPPEAARCALRRRGSRARALQGQHVDRAGEPRSRPAELATLTRRGEAVEARSSGSSARVRPSAPSKWSQSKYSCARVRSERAYSVLGLG